MNFFPQAHAAEGAPAGMGIENLLLIVAFIAIFYFMIWRPQSKRAKEHKELMGALEKGDEVVTSGGIVGRITRVDEGFIMLRIAANTEIRIQKPAVTATLPQGTLDGIEGKKSGGDSN